MKNASTHYTICRFCNIIQKYNKQPKILGDNKNILNKYL